MASNSLQVEQSGPLPRVFIGSSSAALPLAHDIGSALRQNDDIEVQVWNQGIFEPGENLLDRLLRLMSLFDFAVLVLNADDVTLSKDQVSDAPRDNVIFELGLFMGVLGRRRTFPVVAFSQSGDLKLPSDLEGHLALRLDYAKRKADPNYLTGEIAKLRDLIEKRSKELPLSLLPSTALAFGYVKNFLIPVRDHLADLPELKAGDQTFDIRRNNFDFTILVPIALADAGVAGRNNYVRTTGLDLVAVGKPPRVYDFYVDPKPENGRVQLADYPTTLRASHDAIGLVLRPGAVGEAADERLRMEEREIDNFIKALEHLLREPEARFPHRVRIKRVTAHS